MIDLRKFTFPAFLIERYIRALIAIWTLIIVASLVWSIVLIKRETLEEASIQAHVGYLKDVLYRRWNAMHGGVYVPVTEETQPNAYLQDIPERDIVTPSGRCLTLMNPAYMTRQVNGLMAEDYGVRGHITSLNPIRPANAPDPWERAALRTFEKGRTQVSAVSLIEGKEYYRVMHPFVTEKGCLKCHAKQGYHEGDIRGGISVSIPMAPLTAIENRNIRTFAAVHGLLWLAGLVGISLSTQRIRGSERERLQVMAALQAEKEKAQNYLDIAPVVFVLIDEKQNVLLINKRGCETLGYDETEIIGRNWFDNFVPEADRERIRGGFLKLISGAREPIGYFENRILTKSGAERLIAWHNAVLRDEAGKVISTLSSGVDITERKEAEEELKQLTEELRRSNSDLQQFAYIVSHDLQAPLRGISGFVRLLERQYKDRLDAKADEYIDYIVDGVNRMHMLIKDLLEYSQIGTKSGRFEPTNCSVALEQAIYNLHALIEESGTELTYDLLPVVMADAAQMSRLFQNLIGNAIKFRGARPPRIHISAERKENERVFSVRDNGIGIDPEHTGRIFAIFQRLHTSEEYEGTGIGLAICKKIVELHGGRIWVESETGQGSTFHFSIPTAEKSSEIS